MIDLVVGPDLDGDRLDVALAALLKVSRSRAAALIDDGLVTWDGRPATSRSARVRAGARLAVDEPAPPPTGGAGRPVPPIRYQDEHLLVVAKPAGMVVHPGTGNPAGTLVQVLADAGVPLAPIGAPERPGIVHRLDRDTSGLLVVAKTAPAHEGLVAALRARRVGRRYLALVEGRLPGERGRVDAPIGRDPRDRKRFAAVSDGKPAITHWHVMGEGVADTAVVGLVACRLETGRTHQIRVHLAYAGHPVVGDRTYGAAAPVAAALGLDRPFLHAAALAFEHPVTGAPVEVFEPLPEDLVAACRAAGVQPPPGPDLPV